VPTGTVTVTDGSKTCTATLPTTSCSLTFTSPGSKNLVATYSGNGSLIGSTSNSVVHYCQPSQHYQQHYQPYTITSIVGQTVTVAFTVTVNAPGAGTPTGW